MEQNPYSTPQSNAGFGVPQTADLSVKQVLFSFSGRINRAKYWGYSIVSNIGFFAAFFAIGSIFSGDPETGISAIGGILMVILYIPFVWIMFAIQAKRWHDRDKSGWWILINLIPIVGGIWAFIENGCLRGTEGPNQFGADPLQG